MEKHERAGAAAAEATRLHEAITEYEAALRADPSHAALARRLRLELCKLLGRTKQHSRAAGACVDAAALNPESAEPLILRAEARIQARFFASCIWAPRGKEKAPCLVRIAKLLRRRC